MEEVGKIKKFSIEEAIDFAWGITKKNFKFLFVVMCIVLLVSQSQQLISWANDKYDLGMALRAVFFLLNLFLCFVSMVVGIGLLKISVKFVEGEKPEYKDLFAYSNLFFKYFASSIIYFFIVLGGLILLIIPGIIWGIKFQFFPYFILQGDGPIIALKKSSKITFGSKWRLLIFGFLSGIIEIVGFLALLIGLFWAIPVVVVAKAFVFNKLSKDVDFSDLLNKKEEIKIEKIK